MYHAFLKELPNLYSKLRCTGLWTEPTETHRGAFEGAGYLSVHQFAYFPWVKIASLTKYAHIFAELGTISEQCIGYVMCHSNYKM